MLIRKTMLDIQAPQNKSRAKSQPSQRKNLKYSTFILNEVRSPQDIKIDRQLQSIFNRLNQSYSTSINTPHTAFLQQQIDDFLHICQTQTLYD
ncbi:MAG TPA: hypothetical protein ENN77_01860 [Candidatus Wirthbacteria bacterium]|nr:hypothetical protein [Candidatus Wirthbacteria bacterium]